MAMFPPVSWLYTATPALFNETSSVGSQNFYLQIYMQKMESVNSKYVEWFLRNLLQYQRISLNCLVLISGRKIWTLDYNAKQVAMVNKKKVKMLLGIKY
jgi:hypothetical protein